MSEPSNTSDHVRRDTNKFRITAHAYFASRPPDSPATWENHSRRTLRPPLRSSCPRPHCRAPARVTARPPLSALAAHSLPAPRMPPTCVSLRVRRPLADGAVPRPDHARRQVHALRRDRPLRLVRQEGLQILQVPLRRGQEEGAAAAEVGQPRHDCPGLEGSGLAWTTSTCAR